MLRCVLPLAKSRIGVVTLCPLSSCGVFVVFRRTPEGGCPPFRLISSSSTPKRRQKQQDQKNQQQQPPIQYRIPRTRPILDSSLSRRSLEQKIQQFIMRARADSRIGKKRGGWTNNDELARLLDETSQALHVRLDASIFVDLITASARSKNDVFNILHVARLKGSDTDLVYTTAMDFLSISCEAEIGALQLFRKVQVAYRERLGPLMYTSALRIRSRLSRTPEDVQNMEALIAQMREMKFPILMIHYEFLVKAYSSLGLIQQIEDILFVRMREDGLEPNTYMYNNAIECGIKINDEQRVAALVEQVPDPDSYTYSSLLRYMCINDQIDRAQSTLHFLVHKKPRLLHPSIFSPLLDYYVRLASNPHTEDPSALMDLAEDILNLQRSCGTMLDIKQYTMLINGYGRLSNFTRVEELYQEAKSLRVWADLQFYEALIIVQRWRWQQLPGGTTRLRAYIDEMIDIGLYPSINIYAAMCGAYEEEDNIQGLEEILHIMSSGSEAMRAKLKLSSPIRTMLENMAHKHDRQDLLEKYFPER
eukprot:TRINITY_DN6663_c0_g1_i2.p1 TRINITY_DN6663_c0_g1~~TRINITY_DN6663_c0_g1_i2.p1  ORF type:complete len:534 (-),score=73.79 TRINITY_DN6663_c0_g1_i2:9-1610(-)